MDRKLTLTVDRPLTAVHLEKLWDGEQHRQAADTLGRPRLRVHTLDPYHYELELDGAGAAHLSPEQAADILRDALRRSALCGEVGLAPSAERKDVASEAPARESPTERAG